MAIDDAMMNVLVARIDEAEARLAAAIRLDFQRWLAEAVEGRLRARPHFLARTPRDALVLIRKAVDEEADRAAASAAEQVRDLRVWYSASPAGEADEIAGLRKTISDIVEVARRLLSEWCFPGDDKPDRADVTQVDLDAEYKLAYEPSETVLWAFRQARELDGVRNQLVEDPAADGFTVRYHLPELPRPARK